MRPKNDLLLFTKGEIFIILILLGLVALLSFTIGIRLGKTLGVPKTIAEEKNPPLEPAEKKLVTSEEGADETANEAKAKAPVDGAALAGKVQDLTDAQLSNELKQNKIVSNQPVTLDYPKTAAAQKAAKANRYTLQVGSYPTVGEASELVTDLKHKGMDAFYLEARVPGKGTRYRVDVGLFQSKDEAEKKAGEWKTMLPPYILQKVAEGVKNQ